MEIVSTFFWFEFLGVNLSQCRFNSHALGFSLTKMFMSQRHCIKVDHVVVAVKGGIKMNLTME